MPNAPIKPSGASYTDYIVITAPMLAATRASLTGVPAQPTRVLVDIVGGISQGYQNDFTIQGNQIYWASMGLQTLLEVGDIIRVQYYVL